ncbi:GNAT family N-acetyltransferase/peptidase C39 family protein [Pleionea litopenaei]|uniref:GNAT family N-acetyltransferase/peptidase C39 family protein n=1 Tax=Pleionea litopenaei TaxID=3070815 RepID=A0AA51X677_9GAMM|nr:GNAT family N-acetyltransferase/peptidase C39 family protein [Pleionea sp. HL-JVS1]WMS86828.1 GNAT family N-acetyltransferase/peptidase C39 family protein [Pleionea sp. HL-JVS1]
MSLLDSTDFTHKATLADLSSLLTLEEASFKTDRLSKRSFKHHIQSTNSCLLVVRDEQQRCIAYGLVLYHQGTRLARLYSLAVSKNARGQGIGFKLLTELEKKAADNERHYMRLEVAKHNQTAIDLYQANGYRVFGEYQDYYDDHDDALRMQKRIRAPRGPSLKRNTPWFRQSTEFTCGPAALQMAMASLTNDYQYTLENELDIWREATTIYMTSGHGGCHPFGLAIAAHHRGFEADVWLSTSQPLFVDGVRSEHKKQIMQRVHHHFHSQCVEQNISIYETPIGYDDISNALDQNYAVLILVSTYRLDGKKAPHWVVVTGIDNDCLFVHDPDQDEEWQTPLDCQYIPIAHEDFDRMSAFGSQRIRVALRIKLRSAH